MATACTDAVNVNVVPVAGDVSLANTPPVHSHVAANLGFELTMNTLGSLPLKMIHSPTELNPAADVDADADADRNASPDDGGDADADSDAPSIDVSENSNSNTRATSRAPESEVEMTASGADVPRPLTSDCDSTGISISVPVPVNPVTAAIPIGALVDMNQDGDGHEYEHKQESIHCHDHSENLKAGTDSQVNLIPPNPHPMHPHECSTSPSIPMQRKNRKRKPLQNAMTSDTLPNAEITLHRIVSSSSSSSSSTQERKRERSQPVHSFSVSNCISATTYHANNPSEDRYASLTNVLLQDLPNLHQEPHPEQMQIHEGEEDLGPVRMSLFAVMDGHGGAAVAECASQKLLPLMAQRIASAIGCEVLQRGLFQVNGQTVTMEQGQGQGQNQDSQKEDDEYDDGLDSEVDLSDSEDEDSHGHEDDHEDEDEWCYKAPEYETMSTTQTPIQTEGQGRAFTPGEHTTQERKAITRAIQESYLTFDEEWMNSISQRGDRQTFLVHNGKWNSGACCLINVVLQRMSPEILSGDRVSSQNLTRVGDPILYSSHTGDCRALLLSGDAEADVDEVYHEDDLSFRNSCSDSGDEHAAEEDEEEYEVPIRETMIQRIGIRKRPLLNPFNGSNQRFQRRRLWNQSDTGAGKLEDLEDCDSPARIASLRHQGQRSFTAPAGSLEGANDIDVPHSISNVMIRLCSRSPSPMEFSPQPTPMPRILQSTTLTEDHTPYNAREASLVRERCSYAPRAIATSTNGGIQRVAGSLSVTRALGDAYLKTPHLSFEPYKANAPYISAMPEVSSRILTEDDRVLVLASDGVWERVDGDKIAQWVGDYHRNKKNDMSADYDIGHSVGNYRDSGSGSRPTLSRRMRMLPTRKSLATVEQDAVNARILNMTNVSDMIVSRVLNRVRRKYKMDSLSSLMDLAKGTARRSKHDDITAMVIDLEGFTAM